MAGRLHGKVAVVTGAGAGIGRAVAWEFARAGALLAVLDIDLDAAIETTEGIVRTGGQAVAIRVDVAHEEQVAQAMDQVASVYGRIDTLCNNAGIGAPGVPPHELSVEVWDRVVNVNLRGPFICAKHAIPKMGAPGATIINIASTRALMSEANTIPYSASKGGVLALTHSLAVSLGPAIRVNSISPGWIDCSSWQKGSPQAATNTEADHAQHPVGRVGSPEDVAKAALFLATDDSAFMTGANLVLDGGMTIKMIYV